MKQTFAKFLHTFFRKELELRTKIFHVLAMAGVLICVVMIVVSLLQNMMISMAICVLSGIVSIGLLIYSARGGRSEICHWATVVCIFLVLFPCLFVYGGGYQGGMPFFFIFAVVFTVYMLDGWRIWVVTGFELLYYAAYCVFAYYYPQWIVSFPSERDAMIDKIIGFVSVSVALGLTMFVQFRMYQKQQKELEKARADAEAARADAEVANHAKSSFLAHMSHEIRTPIHVITSINELIRTEAPNGKIREYGEKIRDAGELLRGLVDNILDMSKIEAGKTELTASPYRTAELMRVLELTGQTRCQARSLKFHCIKRDLPDYLHGDIPHIQQIIVNLLGNAVKYTETGSVTLTVSCKPGDTPEKTILCAAVTDTGIGIEEASIPHLFDAFTRADLPSHRYIEGTGLGLTIVKELCQLMGGSIRVESRRGWGSTFTVELPQALAGEKDLIGHKESETFIAPEARVLVVDDNAENLSVMRELLHRTRLQVDTLTSGKAALEAVAGKQYHVVLLDYMMPEMDGVETLRRLREIPGFTAPVVVLTANAVAGTREALLEAGFAAYLTKPIPWGRLESLLMELLPPELVTVIHTDAPSPLEAEAFCQELSPQLSPYQIDLRAAMPFFSGDTGEYLRTAEMFLSYSEDERAHLETFRDDPTELVYAVHALKGKARNLGLTALSEEAERLEKLCRQDHMAEALTLLDHLLYLYSQADEGLERLRPRMDALAAEGAESRSAAECRQALPELLGELQRSPALECIDVLLKLETDQAARVLLADMRSAVAGIRFERAQELLTLYLKQSDTGITP